MNLKKKLTVGIASAALVASMGGVVAPSAVADKASLPGFIAGLERLSGADRVATSLAVAAHEWGKRPGDGYKGEVVREKAKRVYLASAEDKHMVDAATAGMLKDGPIVYVSNNVYVGTAVGRFLADTKTYSGFSKLEEVVPIGGDSAIPKSVAQAVADEIKKVNKKAKLVDALAGKDRYGTSVAIADYIYTASMNPENKWYGSADPHTGALHRAYFANGADSHIVDSMVAGTLDNGPILLVQPDGKLPESVVEFIKKTLPGEFGALGGTGAVPDSTVNEAWQIKALANKWDSSYNVPGANKSVRELERLVYGVPGGDAIELDSPRFAGLKKVIEVAEANRDAWGWYVKDLHQKIDKAFSTHKDSKLDASEVQSMVLPLLQKLYGTSVISMTTTAGLKEAGFLKDSDGKYTAVNYDQIEASSYYQDAIKKSKEDLVNMWKSQKQDPSMGTTGILKETAAKLSQIKPADADATTYKTANGVSLRVVHDLAELTVKTDKDWFEYAKKQLAAAKGILRGELDKIDAKTVIRLGGKDRFETAQLIANHWAKWNAAELNSGVNTSSDWQFFETYVANGHRLPDSLTAGQLTRGPIMLVRGGEKNAKELSEFTANVAKRLQCWSDKKHTLKLFGIGGKAVLADSALQAVVDLANTGSVCTPEKQLPVTTLFADKNLNFNVGDTTGKDVFLDRSDTKNTPNIPASNITWYNEKGVVLATSDIPFNITPASPAAVDDGTGNMRLKYTITPKSALAANLKGNVYTIVFTDIDGKQARVTVGIERQIIKTFAAQQTTATVNAAASYYTGDITGARTPATDEVLPAQLTIKKVNFKGQDLANNGGITIDDIAAPAANDNKFRLKFPQTLGAGIYYVTVEDSKADKGHNTAVIEVTVAPQQQMTGGSYSAGTLTADGTNTFAANVSGAALTAPTAAGGGAIGTLQYNLKPNSFVFTSATPGTDTALNGVSVSVNQNTGVLTFTGGAPNAAGANNKGTYRWTITVSDTSGTYADKELQVTVTVS